MKHRRKGREFAIQALYALQVGNSRIPDIYPSIDEGLKLDNDSRKFGILLFEKVLQYERELGEIISKYSINWADSRLAVIDKIILQLAVMELRHLPDIPTKVSINEAVQLANKYSTTESSKFINGILDAISKDQPDIKKGSNK